MTELTELTQSRKYQAFGTVVGILSLSENHSTLLVGETAFPVIDHIPKQVRKFHLPGQIQQFIVFPGALHGKLAFKVLKIVQTSEIGLKLKGCWENRWDVRYLVVYRNSLDNPRDNLLRILVPIDWENAPEPDGRFWEIRAEIQETRLRVIEAEGPFDPPPKATEYQPAVKASKAEAAAKLSRQTPAQSTAPPLTLQEIRDMATLVKAQLTCKLNQVPAYRELPDKQIEFFLNDGSDRIFTVRMKPKQFKKLTDQGFAQWIAAITGELGPTTEKGFELLNATVQVFEKKALADASAGQEKAFANQAKTPSENAAATITKPQSLKTEALAFASARKSLLDRVRMT